MDVLWWIVQLILGIIGSICTIIGGIVVAHWVLEYDLKMEFIDIDDDTVNGNNSQSENKG